MHDFRKVDVPAERNVISDESRTYDHTGRRVPKLERARMLERR